MCFGMPRPKRSLAAENAQREASAGPVAKPSGRIRSAVGRGAVSRPDPVDFVKEEPEDDRVYVNVDDGSSSSSSDSEAESPAALRLRVDAGLKARQPVPWADLTAEEKRVYPKSPGSYWFEHAPEPYPGWSKEEVDPAYVSDVKPRLTAEEQVRLAQLNDEFYTKYPQKLLDAFEEDERKGGTEMAKPHYWRPGMTVEEFLAAKEQNAQKKKPAQRKKNAKPKAKKAGSDRKPAAVRALEYDELRIRALAKKYTKEQGFVPVSKSMETPCPDGMKRETVATVMQNGRLTGYACVGLPWEILAKHYLGAAAAPLESFRDPCPPKMLRSVVTGECEPFKAAGPLKYPKPKAPKALRGLNKQQKETVETVAQMAQRLGDSDVNVSALAELLKM
jgi:hypothetical protein